MRWWETTKSLITVEHNNYFQYDVAETEITLISNVTLIFMTYRINQPGGDFQQDGCLYKPTKHSWTSDWPQKQRQLIKFPQWYSSN